MSKRCLGAAWQRHAERLCERVHGGGGAHGVAVPERPSQQTLSPARSSEAVPVRLHCPGDGADAHTRSINSE